MANIFAAVIKGLIFSVIFLMIWQIVGVSLGIWGIVIFFAIILLTILLSVFSPISKLPNIKTTLMVLLISITVIGVIALVFYQIPRSANYAGNRSQEGFGDNRYHKDYVYYFDMDKGQISIEEERLLVYGTVSIINTDVSYPNPELEFDILVAEGKTAFVEIIFRDVDITTEVSLNFTVGHYYAWQTIEFGVDSQNQIWAEAFGRDPQNLQKSPCSSINTSKPFNVIVKITGDKMENRCAVNIDNVGLGA